LCTSLSAIFLRRGCLMNDLPVADCGLSEATPHGSAKGQLRRPNSQSPFWERNIMRDLKPEEIGHVYGAGGSGHHHHDHHHGHGTSSKKQNRHGTSSKKHAAKTSEKKTRDCKVA
jgi:hypothetical protein